jgi:predicted  nucleic acid-binding Zn-ribbon protein
VVFAFAPNSLIIDMTSPEPLLLLRRLVVLYQGTSVYDQPFHEGVNIIRGRNGSGKSTILDFIFFALGGDFVAWLPEAEQCDDVLAEVSINDTVVTLRRQVDRVHMRPMEIFWGTLEDGLSASFTAWEVFPFKRSESKESFSQLLFRILHFPEVRGEGESNITMHQILRLISVDQLSSVQSLFRDEQFDSPLTRKTVGELLYGIYDDELYEEELRSRVLKRDLERARVEHSSLRDALSDSGEILDVRVVSDAIHETNQQLSRVRSAIKDAETVYEIQGAPEQKAQYRTAEANLRDLRARYASIARDQATLELEIEDSSEFIANLKRRAQALDESVAAEEALGHLALRICPECLQPLDEIEEGLCFLCKKPVGEAGRRNKMAKMGQELVAQIQESGRLLNEKEDRLREKTLELRSTIRELNAAQRRFEDLTERLRSKRDAALDDTFAERGALEERLKFLEKRLRLAERLQELERHIGTLSAEVAELQERITAASTRQEARRIEADRTVNHIAVEFLKDDLPLEETFIAAENVTVDFEHNSCEVNNRPSFSASSMTYLKASVHFAIFFASLELPFFRYPRFIANDNIEDKGLEELRSQNLQRIIVQRSSLATVRHQIIISTSKIAPEFEGSELCVGPAYTLENKSLKFPS